MPQTQTPDIPVVPQRSRCRRPKECFATLEAALEGAAWLLKHSRGDRRGTLEVFHCRKCLAYHLGHDQTELYPCTTPAQLPTSAEK